MERRRRDGRYGVLIKAPLVISGEGTSRDQCDGGFNGAVVTQVVPSRLWNQPLRWGNGSHNRNVLAQILSK